MKWLMFLMAGMAGVGILWAAEQAAPGGNASPAEGSAKTLSEADVAAFSKLKKSEFELSTRIAVLTDLADEHAAKSEAAKADQPQKSDWEKQLAQELRDRAAAASKELGVVTKQTSSFETAHGLVAPPVLAFSTVRAAGALGPDDLIYLSSLQERLSRVQQDLAAALEVSNAHSMDLLTNNTPENVARVSFLTELNGQVLRELEREQADLELRKLEFRALKK